MYDLIVIGGGPGGYVAAIRAAQNGAKVALIEKDTLGGTCLNWGCIPTKSLLESAKAYKTIQNAGDFGIDLDPVHAKPNLRKMVERSRIIVDKLVSGLSHLMDKNKVNIYKGHGRLVSSSDGHKVISIDNSQMIDGKNVIIATGARNRQLPNIPVDGNVIWDCRHAMTATTIPQSLIVIGAGAIGMEFASFYNALGTKVTVIEYAPTILSFADKDINKWALRAFKKKGIEFILGTAVDKVEGFENSVQVTVNGRVLEADRCLVAIGVVPNVGDIGLENVPRIKHNGVIETNRLLTNEPGIYAIGDVASGPWLAHKAMQEGLRCADLIFNNTDTDYVNTDSNHVPMCVYTMPQIAQIGMTEEQAIAAGKKVTVGIYHLSGNGKALAEGNDGLIKVILEENTKIFVGAHMVGEHVTDLISNYAVFQNLEGLPEDICSTIFPHPTLSEGVQEAIFAAIGRPLHM